MKFDLTEQESEFQEFLEWIRQQFNLEKWLLLRSITLSNSTDVEIVSSLFEEFKHQRKNRSLTESKPRVMKLQELKWLLEGNQNEQVERQKIQAELVKGKQNQEQEREFDLMQTRTWELCGAFEATDPSEEDIVERKETGEIVTNYAENVDKILYGGS